MADRRRSCLGVNKSGTPCKNRSTWWDEHIPHYYCRRHSSQITPSQEKENQAKADIHAYYARQRAIEREIRDLPRIDPLAPPIADSDPYPHLRSSIRAGACEWCGAEGPHTDYEFELWEGAHALTRGGSESIYESLCQSYCGDVHHHRQYRDRVYFRSRALCRPCAKFIAAATKRPVAGLRTVRYTVVAEPEPLPRDDPFGDATPREKQIAMERFIRTYDLQGV